MIPISAANDDERYSKYRDRRIAHWDDVCRITKNGWKGWGLAYHQRLREIYQNLIPPGLRILEIGSGTGDLLAALQPVQGVGIDFSAQMVDLAKKRHPSLTFIEGDAHSIPLTEPFDVIILSDVLSELWDVQRVFEQLRQLCTPHTRLIMNSYSRLWESPLALAEKIKVAKPTLNQNWLTREDIISLARLAGFEVFRQWSEIMFPLPFPILNEFCNRFLVKLWPFYHLGMTNFSIARLLPERSATLVEPSVSVIVPARNEAGNVQAIFERMPTMGGQTELIFVEGHSRDDTYQEIEKQIRAHPHKPARLLRQNGVGKGDAVRLGFGAATGDILMILDADLTVPPEDLPKFYRALVDGTGEFINGVRLVYPMEQHAMRFFNLLGNKFFSSAFSWLLGQPIKDTLCGTKVVWKQDYQRIADNRKFFGDFDPFGDFDLLFGAARLNLKLIDLPIRYRERTYGTTNIQRWKHGWLLMRMVAFAAFKLKFR